MDIILLAAGTSSRLKPISDKNLLHFNGKPLVQHQVERLKKLNPNQIIIVGNKHNLKKMDSVFKQDPKIIFAEQSDLNNSQADGVLAGAEKTKSKEVLIVSTNDVFDPELLEKVMNEKNGDGVIVGKQVSSYFPGGYLNVDSEGFLTKIIEKPGEGNEPSDLVNMIVHLYRDFPKFIEKLKQTDAQNDGRYETALDQHLKEAKIKVLKYEGFWQAIKYPWHIHLVMNYFLEKQESLIHPTASIAKTAVIHGNVMIEEGVKIMDNAVIQGPAYIGKNSIIANNSLIRSSMVGENSVIGFNTEVARSYLNHKVWTHSNYIGDSIVDFNVSFGSGSVTGNLRFDEKEIKVTVKKDRLLTGRNKLGAIIGNGVRFGINCSTNPGVKIGQNSFIGAGVLVERDIENQKIIALDQSLKIIDNPHAINVEDRCL